MYGVRYVRYWYVAVTPRNKIEFHKIFEELVQLPREIADSLSRFIFDVKYNFMFLDCTSGKIYKNLTLSK